MTSSKSPLALLLMGACAWEHPEAQKKQARAPTPVRISDAEAEKALVGVKLSEPRLCDESCSDRDPALFTDLDAFRKSEGEPTKGTGACTGVAPVASAGGQGQAKGAEDESWPTSE
jgi:hypothetical protein